MLEGGAPLLDAAVDRQLVEARTLDLQPHLRVRRDVLRDLRARQLDAIELHVASPAQLQPHDESQRLERRNLRKEVPHALLDEASGVRGGGQGLKPSDRGARDAMGGCWATHDVEANAGCIGETSGGAQRRPAPASRRDQILWRSRSLRPITMRWISDVPSPISSSGASR